VERKRELQRLGVWASGAQRDVPAFGVVERNALVVE
jgi:hypothetical protein